MSTDQRRRILKPVKKAGLFPEELFAREWSRRNPPRVGVGLSGGGIRSATLSLGLFQGLARLGLIRYVDYLSTVSGGGYFGAFLGHLFQRRAGNLSAAGDATVAEAVEKDLADGNSPPLKFLRENGRYLSPNGAGDTLLGAAVALRNWGSVMVVMGLFALMLLGLAVLGRHVLATALLKSGIHTVAWPLPWLSPFFLLAAAAIPLFVMPPAWAYWLVRDNLQGRKPWQSAANWFVPYAGIAGGIWGLVASLESFLHWALLLWGGVSLMTTIRYGLGRLWAAWQRIRRKKIGAGPEADENWLRLALRRDFSRGLMRSLIAIGVLLGLAVVDTVGQFIFHLQHMGMAAAYGMLAALIGLLRGKVTDLTRRFGANEKPPLPANLVLHGAALLLAVAFLGAVASVPHFVALGAAPLPDRFPAPPLGGFSRLSWLIAAAAVLAFVTGRVWSFVNRSSLHALYEARLRRAYLGASNPERMGEGKDRPPVTEPHPGDGFSLDYYDPAAHGGPVHLINVTVNETVDGRSQVQQRDRKGMGMAIGPGGVSVGRMHHALWEPKEEDRGLGRIMMEKLKGIFGAAQSKSEPDAGTRVETEAFKVFPRDTEPEKLDVGQWMAISGAAFSTGLGAHTNIGLSLLAGMLNVRLGYWWETGINPAWRSGRTARTGLQRLEARLRRLFPVQSSLLDEWLARFPGVAGPEWYLSDGGHFENLAGYELIRRRLPYIILCDNEQDVDYRFEGLANLVRKARVDFGTEIEFLSPGELKEVVSANGAGKWIGTLADLRRGLRSREEVPDTATGEARIHCDGDRTGRSLAHAALARIRYPSAGQGEEPDPAWLLYIKPTLVGDEPIDVENYHSSNPDFPHESTADQYFDEAQWESYRKLGEQIADRLFADPDAAVGRARHWSPRRALESGRAGKAARRPAKTNGRPVRQKPQDA